MLTVSEYRRARRDPPVRCGRCGGQGQEMKIVGRSAPGSTDNGDAVANLEVWGDRRTEDSREVLPAVGNQYVSKGPHDLNGHGYFNMRLCCTGVGHQTNVDEEYVLLSALLHFSCWFEASVKPETVRSGLPSSQQRSSRFRATERDLHEVLFFLIFPSLCPPSETTRVQGTRRPHRIRLVLRALVLDRSWFPSALSHISAILKRT